MPLFRGLLLLFAIWLAIAVVRRLYVTRSQHSGRAATTTPRMQYVAVMPCHRCGVHIPKAEAIARNGRYFCGSICHDSACQSESTDDV